MKELFITSVQERPTPSNLFSVVVIIVAGNTPFIHFCVVFNALISPNVKICRSVNIQEKTE